MVHLRIDSSRSPLCRKFWPFLRDLSPSDRTTVYPCLKILHAATANFAVLSHQGHRGGSLVKLSKSFWSSRPNAVSDVESSAGSGCGSTTGGVPHPVDRSKMTYPIYRNQSPRSVFTTKPSSSEVFLQTNLVLTAT